MQMILEMLQILLLFGLAALASTTIVKIHLYRSERLRQLSEACTKITDESKRRELEDALHATLKSTLSRSNSSFVDYYKNDVSQFGRAMYIVGAAAVLLAASVVFVSALFNQMLPEMNSLAADTIIVGQYGFLHALEDASVNMSIAITVAALTFPPAIWLFMYIGKRLPVAYKIMFSNGETAEEPAQTKWSHVMFITVGFVLPFAFVTYIGYLISCSVQLENIDVRGLTASEYAPGNDVRDKLEVGKLAVRYEAVCGNGTPQDEDLDTIWENVTVRRVDQVLRLVDSVTSSECLKEKIADSIRMNSFLDSLSRLMHEDPELGRYTEGTA